MAVDARDAGLTRETFAQWLDDYQGDPDLDELRDYIMVKLEQHKLDTVMVDTRERTDVTPDESSLIDLIMEDLPSYASYHKIFPIS